MSPNVIDWHDCQATSYAGEWTMVGKLKVTVCLDDESHTSQSSYYWCIEDTSGRLPAGTPFSKTACDDGWAGTIAKARREALTRASVLQCDLPRAMKDGRPAAWLRIGSHRALGKVRVAAGPDNVEEFVNMRSEHVFLVPEADVERIIAALPAYCRNSAKRVRRVTPVDGWGRAWS